eukprot:c4165_g1_i2.p1 GENE.c4165_g1_i2~~c4165_g1_i2.p1  ORF type:complete len:200 (+),score=38.55 c4165_g1_i2:104-703(+)
MQKSYDLWCKIVFVGDSGVGKSCFLKRYSDHEFNPTMQSTIGVDFVIKTIDVDGKLWKLQIWDTAGQEKFRAVTPTSYRGAHVVVVCYDCTNEETFEHVTQWIDDVRRYCTANTKVLLLATKCDLQPAVLPEAACKFAQANHIPWLETSALSGKNVTDAILLAVNELRQSKVAVADNSPRITFGNDTTTVPTGKRFGCC